MPSPTAPVATNAVPRLLRTCVCKLSFTQTEDCFQDLLHALSDERRAHVLAFKHNKDRFRSLFAELLLRHALAEISKGLDQKSDVQTEEGICNRELIQPQKEGKSDSDLICVSEERNRDCGLIRVPEEILIQATLSSSQSPLRFEYGPHGKPALLQETVPPVFMYSGKPLCFSLSHSGAYIACTVSVNECGVDIQEIRSVRDALFQKNLACEEQNDLACFEGAMRAKRFFEYWVLKESYIKAIGQGLSFPLKKAAFRIGEDGYVEMISDPAFEVRLFEVEDGYTLAAGAFLSHT